MKRPSKKAVEAVYEHGHLKLLHRLPLKEHQRVWVAVLPSVPYEPSAHDLGILASQSPSYQFLADPSEDVYSLHDGQPV